MDPGIFLREGGGGGGGGWVQTPVTEKSSVIFCCLFLIFNLLEGVQMAISRKTVKKIFFQDYRGGGVQHFPRGWGVQLFPGGGGGGGREGGGQIAYSFRACHFQGRGSRSAQFNLTFWKTVCLLEVFAYS